MFLRLESLISILFLGHLKLLLLAQSLHAVQDPPPEIRRAACARDAGSFGPTSRSNFPRLESVDRAESGRSVRSGGAVLVLDGPSFGCNFWIASRDCSTGGSSQRNFIERI
jgi:hypothetical protein